MKSKRYLRYDEKLVVPIIENTPFERDLADSMYAAMMKYPIRRHGVYVWGAHGKSQTRRNVYDYLFFGGC
ncbi:putative methylthioribulose-1-phosphate dehydratase [Lucilia cuprina]|nr:putative methylthioribulose-1-phosphate dehydratase [Lucilia cuprina]